MSRLRLSLLLAVSLGAACSGEREPDTAESAPPAVAAAANSPTPTTAAADSEPASGCLGDQGGCRARVMSFLPCDGEVALPQIPIQQLLADPARHAGQAIAVTGPLIKLGAECTEGECEQTCCNTCTSVVAVGDAERGHHVRLISAETPGLYLCRGDESLLCCQFPTDGRAVVAQGVFQVSAGLSPPVYQLFATELCTPSPTPPEPGS